jgi:hypothetical protein
VTLLLLSGCCLPELLAVPSCSQLVHLPALLPLLLAPVMQY